jgi:hypothetical protein
VAGHLAVRPIAFRLQSAMKPTMRAAHFAYLAWVIPAPTDEEAFLLQAI